jgi:hypothetical protein
MRRDRIAGEHGLLNDARQSRHERSLEATIVNGVNELGWRGHMHLGEDEIGQASGWSPTIELPHDGRQGSTADPESTTLVTKQVPPAAGPAGASITIHTICDRPGSRDDDDTRLVTSASYECHEGVIDDDDTRLGTDALHDSLHGPRIGRAIDSGHAKADRVRPNVALPECVLHDAMQDLFDFEFAGGLEVGAGAMGLRQYAAVAVGKKAHGLRATSVDTQYVHRVRQVWYIQQVRWRTATVGSAARSLLRASRFKSDSQS